jgi:cell division GTPase FtsZ
LIESLESLIEMIYNPGMINIDFADVRAILKGRGMTAFLNIAEASGKNRAEEINEKILKNPLISSNLKPEKILFDISGASNLSMLEVDKISRRIAELNPKAKIIFGISKNQKSKNKIKTTLLITGPSIAVPKEEIKEEKPLVIAKLPEIKKAAVAKPAGQDDNKQEGKKKIKKKKPAPAKIKIVKEKEPAAKKVAPKKIVSAELKEEEKPAEKKEMIRRNALEAKKVEEIEESRRIKEDAEWEIPAFLRRMKSKP